ncbi:hypothetical protein D7D25_00990 [Proteiniphilum sp. X52]|nr:hypothetical protein D7D25_00990 [Proteiniphilum sp. X52]
MYGGMASQILNITDIWQWLSLFFVILSFISKRIRIPDFNRLVLTWNRLKNNLLSIRIYLIESVTILCNII